MFLLIKSIFAQEMVIGQTVKPDFGRHKDMQKV